MVTARIGCDSSAENIAQSVLAVASDAEVANCFKVVVDQGCSDKVARSTSAETELAAAEVATARAAAANLRKIEAELLAEIEAIIGRADTPQLGDENALRELHTMLARARTHLQGPLARAEQRAAERLAVARDAKKDANKKNLSVGQPNQTHRRDVATSTRYSQPEQIADAFRAWCSLWRRTARAQRLVDRWRSARLRATFRRLLEATRLLLAQRKQESYRLALSELQARMGLPNEGRKQLFQQPAEVEKEIVDSVDLRTLHGSTISSEHDAVNAGTRDATHASSMSSLNNETVSWVSCMHRSSDAQCEGERDQNTATPFQSTIGRCDANSGDGSSADLLLGMIKLRGHRRQEAHGIFCRPYLIYEYEVSVGPEVWQGEKRYSDFEQLHNRVVDTLGADASRVVEMRNMQLPPKRYVGNLTPAVGDERLLIMQHYLTQLGYLASPATAASGELPQNSVDALYSVLFAFVRQQHQVVAADFVVAAATSYFERIEHLREAFAKCDTKGTGRLSESDIVKFLADSSFTCAANSDIAAELRDLRGSGLISRLKESLAAEANGSDSDGGLTLVDVEGWWSQHCLRTQSACARNSCS